MHPRDRLARLRPRDRDPEEKERRSAERGERGARAFLGGGHHGERRDREQRKVMKIERNGGQESDRREVPRTFRQHERQEKEQKSREGKKRVGARFGGIEEEQRGDARQNDEPDSRRARGKSERSGEESESCPERERSRQNVAGETLADGDERLLQEIEEGGARVVAQDVQKLTEREPRRPQGKDLVEPERAIDQEPEARGRRSRGDEEYPRERETGATLR